MVIHNPGLALGQLPQTGEGGAAEREVRVGGEA